MFTIYPKAVKVFKAALANSNAEVENHVETDIKPNSMEKQVAKSSQKTQKAAVTAATKKAATKKAAKDKVTKKPLKATIGLFYSYYKRPLNYLFSILAKPRKTAEQKETVKSLMAGLRKAEVKFQKEHKFTDSIVDLLINQRSLKLGRLEASFDAATASAVAELKAGGEIGVFYNMHKRPLNYLFALLKSPKLEKSDKKIVDSLVKGLRKAETSFMKDNDIKQSILDKLLKQRKLKLEASAFMQASAINSVALEVVKQGLGRFFPKSGVKFKKISSYEAYTMIKSDPESVVNKFTKLGWNYNSKNKELTNGQFPDVVVSIGFPNDTDDDERQFFGIDEMKGHECIIMVTMFG